MDPDAIGKTFATNYYATFDNNRSELAKFYQPNSVLTFEGVKVEGAQTIGLRFNDLGFPRCKHEINSIDCQSFGTGVIVFVSGTLRLNPTDKELLKFSEMFILMERVGGHYVLHDIFRLNHA